MNSFRSDGFSSFPWLIGLLAVTLLAVTIAIGRHSKSPPVVTLEDIRSNGAGVNQSSADRPISDPADRPIGDTAARFETFIRSGPETPRILLSEADPLGRSGSVACSTCHSVREPNLANKTPADLDQFHQGMKFSHGSLTCYSCHNMDDTDTLRLADSTAVEYPDVMTLCAQCHGPQWRDYQHGAHGGMNGFWDTSRGPRTRNHCVDCHDPHVPKFPSMKPVFKTKDRFLAGSELKSPESKQEVADE